MRKGLLLFCLLIALVGCSQQTMTPIAKKQSVSITFNLRDQSLTFINNKTMKKIATWQVDEPFTGGVLFPDQDRILLYGKQMTAALVYRLSTGEHIAKWETGEGIVNGLLLDDETVVLVDQLKRAVREFSLSGKEKTSYRVGLKPLSVFEQPATKRLYVVNFGETTLSVIDRAKHEVVDKWTINSSSTGGVLLNNSDELWIGGHGKGSRVETNVHVLSLTKKKVVAQFAAPVMPIHFRQIGDEVVVISHGSSMVRKFTTKTKKLVAELKIGANPFSASDDGTFVYIASYDSHEVFKIDLQTWKVVGRVSVGKGPFQILSRT